MSYLKVTDGSDIHPILVLVEQLFQDHEERGFRAILFSVDDVIKGFNRRTSQEFIHRSTALIQACVTAEVSWDDVRDFTICVESL